MVSFWPWGGDSSSPASFEKTLSTLSVKITDTQAQLDRIRSSSRRVRVLWTLYLGFAYLVYAIVLLLVVGYKNLGAYEWTGMAGGPILIYATRTIIATYFSYRIDTISARLSSFQVERTKTIQKLKDATRYDSTMQLIEKYGGDKRSNNNNKKKKDKSSEDDGARSSTKAARQPGPNVTGRTNLPPPPTANIVRRDGTQLHDAQRKSLDMQAGAEFAPNAFNSSPLPPLPPASSVQQQQQRYMSAETHWYDRIFDVLLGEDEAAIKNRFALICQSCRLVNGQAPPGTKNLSEVGIWRCSGCGAANGEEDEGKRIMAEVFGSKNEHDVSGSSEEEHVQGLAGDDDLDRGRNMASTATAGSAGSVKAHRRKSEK